MRKTYALIQVVNALLEDPDARHWGYDLSRRSGVRSGVMYPILHRMLDEGWLEDGWDNSRKQPRRYYELTPNGRIEIHALRSEALREPRFASLSPAST